MAVNQTLFSEHGDLPVNAPSSKLSEIIVPRCTYTEPEVASAGLNAASAEHKGVEVDQFKFNLDDNDRCILEGSFPGGFVKIFCKKGTEEIVGAVVSDFPNWAERCTHTRQLVKQCNSVACNSIDLSG